VKNPKISHIDADSLLTSYQVGVLLQVNPSSVNKWVKDGRIPAFRTPGGHRRIRASDLVGFLNKYSMPVPNTLVNAARKRLLIVDDDIRQLDAMQKVLKPYAGRIEVLLVDNGIDALIQAGAFRPHVMVLDVYMPNLDGIEVCKRMRELEATKEAKIIINSGDLSPAIEEKAKAAGAHVCLPKPIGLPVILEALDISVELGMTN